MKNEYSAIIRNPSSDMAHILYTGDSEHQAYKVAMSQIPVIGLFRLTTILTVTQTQPIQQTSRRWDFVNGLLSKNNIPEGSENDSIRRMALQS